MSRTSIPKDYWLNKFELRREELLARYEGSPSFRPVGNYTAGQFAGRQQGYAHRLVTLLKEYVTEHPHLRDALGLELSRYHRGSAKAYQFDGLLLPVRLARRVGRLYIPPDRHLFPALDRRDPNYSSPAAVRQRYHYARALAVAAQLARSATREQLTNTITVSALQRLRAFGPTDQQMQEHIIGQSPTPELTAWWIRCGLQDDRATLRLRTRADQEAAYEHCRQTPTVELTEEDAREQVVFARQAVETGSGNGFSAIFYARYFACAALPVTYHPPAARVVVGVAVLYGLPTELLTDSERRGAIACLHDVLRDAKQSVSALFFTELGRQPGDAAERLRRHLHYGRFRQPVGLLASFYEAVGACLDPEEEELPVSAFQQLTDYLQTHPTLSLARAELIACAASQIQAFYTTCDFSNPTDQLALQRGYELLRPLLPVDEAETIEETLLEQAQASSIEAKHWLEAPGFLAVCLRERLRYQLRSPELAFNSLVYQHLRQMLVRHTPTNELPANDQLFLTRYDAQYFLCHPAIA